MNPEKIITGVAGVQPDGLVCVVWGRDYLGAAGSVPVLAGRSLTGSQVFGCAGRCGEAAGADPSMGGAWVVVVGEHCGERRAVGAGLGAVAPVHGHGSVVAPFPRSA